MGEIPLSKKPYFNLELLFKAESDPEMKKIRDKVYKKSREKPTNEALYNKLLDMSILGHQFVGYEIY